MTPGETQANTARRPKEHVWHALWHAPLLEQLVKPILFEVVAQAERQGHISGQDNKLLRASLVTNVNYTL